MVDEKDTKQKSQKCEEEHSKKDILEKIPEEARKLSHGFIFAGLESLSVTADMARTFVDEMSKKDDSSKSDKLQDRLKDLPKNMVDAFFETLDKSIDKTEKVVDKFNEKYKEA
ncbi:hypothetical protein SCALIN_C01_0099 [Candidatus Scalindua japonica]|uniref:Uncharacterized protein n=1 Tax=Candidatus Scalindua japonica TaxID=1284222 RepID=A0A286TTH3_9BACT|nr:hypothetical protein [Candidatus Scalindua japonica]GAX59168.1 hypothetical protein SCALIN_C01_0099 [Candidatus Scalindua japonica]